ncbi:RES family NAD+ phosphorylase [Azohydromonas caseinilytica]|uniref:RES family NAD+ phosphorylase n=1 Tax=Azohydromonas caseinilytica TaxID=2728836 RepID=A0A848FDF7_9BURK|nr:RES family NAD+ phosphorylase [Azohydromonas caseinilytica]NML15961.1 RES family NAD+ phosphorylase [Azohydromonas caseinilytica]
MSCRAPTPPLDALIDLWPAGRVIHVIHDTAFAPESFNPGIDAAGVLRKPTRFAPIRDRDERVVPYLYGGSSLECAIFETVFHNVPMDAARKFVDLDDFADRGHGRLTPARDLRLVNLTTDGLHRLKVPKTELIASAPIDYPDTARWAQALHRQYPDIDGLFWMSRQRDPDQALVLFGDRVGAALSGQRVGGPLRLNDTLRQAVIALALRAGIEAA